MTDPVPEGDDAGRPVLLVVGSGFPLYREYLLRAVSARYRIWLLDATPPTWQRPFVFGATEVDARVVDDAVAAARRVEEEHGVAGVLCYDEALVWPAAFLAEALGLPGNPPEVVRSCRDKLATREALDRAGVPQARSVCVSSAAEAAEAAADIGYPVILKPRGLGASQGVIRVDRATDFDDGYVAARSASFPGVPVYEAGVLVEEYLDGPEISIDSVFHEGRCHPCFLARKQVGFDPFFEEVGHVVRAGDPLLADAAVLDVLESAHEALGWRTGATHTEIKLTSRGPRLIEVNARLGGDFIPYLGWLATGTDLSLATADVAAGRAPELTATHAQVAAIRFLYPSEDCEVLGVDVHEDRVAPPVHSVKPMARPGAVLRLPPNGYVGRYAFVIAVADDEETCTAGLDAGAELVDLHAAPLVAAARSAQ